VILVDTSVWVEVFRRPSRIQLETIVDFDEIVTCLPVIQEALQGFRDPAIYRRASTALYALPCVGAPLTLELYEEAIDLYRTARRGGITIRSSLDCLIAACALRHSFGPRAGLVPEGDSARAGVIPNLEEGLADILQVEGCPDIHRLSSLARRARLRMGKSTLKFGRPSTGM
jgi:predicted nucleic acid-binding protein